MFTYFAFLVFIPSPPSSSPFRAVKHNTARLLQQTRSPSWTPTLRRSLGTSRGVLCFARHRIAPGAHFARFQSAPISQSPGDKLPPDTVWRPLELPMGLCQCVTSSCTSGGDGLAGAVLVAIVSAGNSPPSVAICHLSHAKGPSTCVL